MTKFDGVEHAKKLWILEQVLEVGSFRAAALKAKVSTPAISQAISSLEKLVGKPLLIRKDGKIFPTDAAQQLIVVSKPAIQALRELSIHAEPSAVPNIAWISFGAYESLAVDLLPKLTERLQLKLPKLKLTVRIASNSTLATMVRNGVQTIMANLETNTNPTTNLTSYSGVQVSFRSARLMAVQSYLAITWSLADRIAAYTGQVLCPGQFSLNLATPPSLVSSFITNGTKQTTALVHSTVRSGFGWPVGLSYAVRNHFIHDGAEREGWTFFDGPAAAAAFRISDDGWAYICTKTKEEYRVDGTHTRAPEIWPWPQNDLRKLLEICHRELDDALGTMLGSASSLLKSKVSLLLGAS